ncbi:hypothetical protein EN829_007205 [Mesorhizobium sp. M00.F.Ca.ET.186.01.1.1]|nr:hypothetical protein EN848_01460 [bacterium M00.F.Ca.ET.205.01.1.1]TGU54526.1 hypothetical protein EN795_05875 [bacterium M00.F.Ca.ET.152.01.1.1]TGV38689.1 hypothetical protein EN829_007205 [Mesorhizobium sp. M00.F.Ca.ET.186.01.1.1]TGZ44098.1 hypothetical protein EN805_05880 [bacterium M00.F.Ca.ET.162.01.1.1]
MRNIGYLSFLSCLLVVLYPNSGFGQQIEELSRQELFVLARTSDPSLINMALPPHFKFPADARSSSEFGIDVSHHTEDSCKCKISWSDVVLAKVKFVYFKATQGLAFKDTTSTRNWDAVHQLQSEGKLRVGYYHFMTATSDAGSQADFFLSQIAPADSADLPPSLDVEWNAGPYSSACPPDAILTFPQQGGGSIRRCDVWSTVSGDDIIARVNIWIDKVRTITGRDPIVYTNTSWWKARIGDVKKVDRLHTDFVWIADYSKSGLATEKPRSPNDRRWHIWQFSESAAIRSGQNTLKVDANIAFGPLDALFNQ